MLPCRSTVITTFSGAMPSLWALPSMMRLLAWCGTNQSMSSAVLPVASNASSITSVIIADRMLEDLAALHAQMADGLGRGRPAVDVELVLVAAVGAQMRGQNAAVVAGPGCSLRFQHHRAGAIAEQHAGGAVVPVEDAREGLGADHQRALEAPGLQQSVGGRQRINKARADRLQVERGAVRDAKPACTVTAVAGKVWSGVEVASTIRSIAWASTRRRSAPPLRRGCARSEVKLAVAAICRSRMPVRCTIHSSEVSTLAPARHW